MHYFLAGIFIPEYAASIRTDWNSFYGFFSQPDVNAFLFRLKRVPRKTMDWRNCMNRMKTT